MRELFDAGAIMADLGDFYPYRGTLMNPGAGAAYASTGQKKASAGAPVAGLENLACEIAPLKGSEVVSNRPSSTSANPSSQTLVISTHKVAFAARHDAITSEMVFQVAAGPYAGRYEITRIDPSPMQTVLEISKVK